VSILDSCFTPFKSHFFACFTISSTERVYRAGFVKKIPIVRVVCDHGVVSRSLVNIVYIGCLYIFKIGHAPSHITLIGNSTNKYRRSFGFGLLNWFQFGKRTLNVKTVPQILKIKWRFYYYDIKRTLLNTALVTGLQRLHWQHAVKILRQGRRRHVQCRWVPLKQTHGRCWWCFDAR